MEVRGVMGALRKTLLGGTGLSPSEIMVRHGTVV